ncbi:MAG: hypothetical protein RMA76_20405 [Deltaproteobacteria bacterium]
MRGLALLLLVTLGCAHAPPAERKNRVLVLVMIHDGHRTSTRYGVDALRALIERVDPDYVLAEIPPDRFEAARAQFAATGTITEPRVRRFPEYTDVVFPLTRTMDFEIVPCAAWTRAMADDRKAKLTEWKATRPEESREVDAAMEAADAELEAKGWADDPAMIHTDAYDAIVERGMEPYDRLFNEDLGPGGWTNINRAHFGLIARALDAHRGEGKLFVVTFGAWHKGRFRRALLARGDVVEVRLEDFE